MSRPVVIKLGGSLFDWPGLPAALTELLDDRRGRGERIVLVAGGGAAADFIRTIDETFTLGDISAHRLAVRAMDLTAHVLAALVSGLDVVEQVAGFAPVWNGGRIPILAPRRFLEEDDERSTEPLPATWDVTSDSIAARLAVALGAAELVLLKSASLPPGADTDDAARLGLVDPRFPHASRTLPRVVFRNLRLPAP